jgi:hypothetical protein
MYMFLVSDPCKVRSVSKSNEFLIVRSLYNEHVGDPSPKTCKFYLLYFKEYGVWVVCGNLISRFGPFLNYMSMASDIDSQHYQSQKNFKSKEGVQS